MSEDMIIEVLNKRKQSLGLSNKVISTFTGLSEKTICNILSNRQSDLKLSTLILLLDCLNITLILKEREEL